jgi:hypothetical protein
MQGLSADCFFIREDFTQGPGHDKKKHYQQQQQSEGGISGVAQSRSVYYFPPPVRAFLAGDADGRLKCVSAGVKVFERKNKHLHGEIEYRLVQVVVQMHIYAYIDVICILYMNVLGGR